MESSPPSMAGLPNCEAEASAETPRDVPPTAIPGVPKSLADARLAGDRVAPPGTAATEPKAPAELRPDIVLRTAPGTAMIVPNELAEPSPLLETFCPAAALSSKTRRRSDKGYAVQTSNTNAPKASLAVVLFGPPYLMAVAATSVSTP